jgi:uncharacterized membrane protein
MVLLIYGFILFLEIYCVSMIVDQWRKDQVDHLDVETSQVFYTLISIAGVVFMTLGYLKAKPQPITIWISQPLGWFIYIYFSLVSLMLIAAAYVPRNAIKVKLKEPMLVGVIVWAICHLTTIGSLAGIILFGSFLPWAILDLISCQARRSALHPVKEKASVVMSLVTIAAGVVVFLPFAHTAFGIVRS